jgi:phosphoribosylformylglycinamidine synthase
MPAWRVLTVARLPPEPMASALTLMHFEGGNAWSDFRAAGLLARLQAAVPRVTAASARFVHWVAFDAQPEPALVDKLAALLAYGPRAQAAAGGALIAVGPRLGTVSPWASKASDIVRNCGVPLHRVERVVEVRLALKAPLLGSAKPLDGDEFAALAALLHDRMTETVFARREDASTCSAAAARRSKRPTPSSAWRWPTTRSTTSSRPLPCAWAATPATPS